MTSNTTNPATSRLNWLKNYDVRFARWHVSVAVGALPDPAAEPGAAGLLSQGHQRLGSLPGRR